jgi:hypothetical protein
VWVSNFLRMFLLTKFEASIFLCMQAIVVTPVKNALENTLETIQAVAASVIPVKHYVYNDKSDAPTKEGLIKYQAQYGYELIHIEDLTDHPSPNYKLVLQEAQKKALALQVPLIIVESDVVVKPDTFQKLVSWVSNPKVGMVGAITVDAQGIINFPYLKFKNKSLQNPILKTTKSLSFCCTLLTVPYLSQYSFMDLDVTKDWYDTFISKKSIELGFENYVLLDVPVFHKPHGSRPWKMLKYTNPLKYYFLKFTQRRDKI